MIDYENGTSRWTVIIYRYLLTDVPVSEDNRGVNKIRFLLRKQKDSSSDSYVYQLASASTDMSMKPGHFSQYHITKIWELEFSRVFHDYFPLGVPPKQDADHRIEIRTEDHPPHKHIFQFSPAELLDTKDWVAGLFKKGKIRPINSPYGLLFFFFKQKNM